MLNPALPRTPRTGVEPGPPRRVAPGALQVLVVEDDPLVRQVCAELAGSQGCEVTTADSVPPASALVQQRPVDLVFLDLRLPGGSGIALFDEIRTQRPRALVVVMSAYATVGSAVELMRKGAFDFLQKPFGLEQISGVLDRANEHRRWSEPSRALEHKLSSGSGASRLIGASPAMQRIFRMISKLAFTRHPVLIQGERGTGKELVVRTIHGNGPDPATPFVTVDCDSLAREALGDELFGSSSDLRPHIRWRAGVLATAGQGTVYLDEIGSLPPPLQVKLLRTLEQRRVFPMDGGEGVPLESRLMAANSRDLEQLVNAGQFRRDLFYRLNTAHLRLPPLRERIEDVPLLVDHFLAMQSRERGAPLTLSEQVLHWMLAYHWPGNIRELESVILRIGAVSSGPVVLFDDLSTQLQAYAQCVEHPVAEQPAQEAAVSEILTMEQTERRAIQQTLKECNGDKIRAAKLLGIGKTTLYRKLKEYGIGGAP